MPPRIIDEFTELKVSRERKRHLRNEKKGLCRCGKQLVSDASLCAVCLLVTRKRMRNVNGCKPKRPGCSGRTQLIPDDTK